MSWSALIAFAASAVGCAEFFDHERDPFAATSAAIISIHEPWLLCEEDHPKNNPGDADTFT